MPEQAPEQAPERVFSLVLAKSELNFIANAIFNVDIKSKDAKFVGDLQQKLVGVLTAPAVPADPAE